MLPLPTSPIPVALAAVLLGLAAARLRRRDAATSEGPLRAVAVHGVPAIATAAVAVVVWTTPVAVWAWVVAGTLGLASVVAPFANGLAVSHRAPTPAETSVLERVPADHGGDVRVADADGAVTGYAAGDPLTGTVVVSAGAIASLPPRAVAALVAHERAHHERRHALFRAGTSGAVLAAGIGGVALALSGATAIGIGVLAVLAAERLLAAAVARRTEYVADAIAARRQSPGATVALLSALPPEAADRSPIRRALSSHPPPERRIAAVRERFDVA